MFKNLSTLSEELSDLVERGGRSVVRVETRQRGASSGIVWSEDGTVVTSNQGLHRSENLRVGMPDGSVLPATLAGRDPSTDLAVLRINATGLEPAPGEEPPETDTGNLRVGSIAIALGRPGRSVRASLGIISAVGGGWRTPAGGSLERFLQTDLSLLPGFSGGPLLVPAGRLLGLNSTAMFKGLSLAIPTTSMQRIVAMLLEHGRIPRGYLGISTYPVILSPSLHDEVGQQEGLLLIAVEEAGPADGAGLLVGDILLSVGEQRVSDLESLLASLAAERIGTTLPVSLLRGGRREERTVAVGER
jgi:S1-C subfamily serine protease